MILKECALEGGGGQGLIGIVHEPDSTCQSDKGAVVVFLCAGNTHRAGPNRLYVNLARELAKRGHYACRFDFSGIGDSPARNDGERFRTYAVAETRQVIDDLLGRSGRHNVVLFGLCGGADIAFDVAASDDRVGAAVLVNGAFVDGDVFADLYHEAERRTLRRFYASHWFSLRRWLRLATFQSMFWRKIGVLLRHPPSPRSIGKPRGEIVTPGAIAKWRALAERGVELLLAYSEGSVFWDLFLMANRDYLSGHYPAERLRVAFQKHADHTFTLASAQERLKEDLMNWLGGLTFASRSNCRGERQ